MFDFEYSLEQGIELFDQFLLPKGYERTKLPISSPDNHIWVKYLYDENDVVTASIIINLDMTAKVNLDIGIGEYDGAFVKSYTFEEDEDETESVFDLLKEARDTAEKDLDELHEFLKDLLCEKKPDNVYTLVFKYNDYGRFDEDGIPGVETTDELEYFKLEEALNEFYTCVSLNEEALLYKGNTDITADILHDKELFKKFYDNKKAFENTDFNGLTYEQALQCVDEYADHGYSELLDTFVHTRLFTQA